MKFDLPELFGNMSDIEIKDTVAQMLQTTPTLLEEFEKAYHVALLKNNSNSSNRDFSQEKTILPDMDLINRIVNELLNQTSYLDYDGDKVTTGKFIRTVDKPVTVNEILSLPEQLRPQLSGNLMKKDIDKPVYSELLMLYKKFLDEGNMLAYHVFRQGLDILDLDPIIYAMLGMNKVSMSYWLPPIIEPVQKQRFFKIPKTRIVRVPISILQMSRIEYSSLTQATLKIIDDWAFTAFDLDPKGDYFIKTGTYSSKFDFRNARVVSEKEVHELGEYLLYIQNNACQMAGPLNRPCYYGVSTTNEWVVREFIDDPENNPTIYQGLPLRTEYRFFIDFDCREILGVNPYWDPQVMKDRFSKESDANHPHMKHDYIIYKMHEDTLMQRYNDTLPLLTEKVKELLDNDVSLTGQWSFDIMRNGVNDYYVIDMATADSSALSFCIPEGKLKKSKENWLPSLKNRLDDGFKIKHN